MANHTKSLTLTTTTIAALTLSGVAAAETLAVPDVVPFAKSANVPAAVKNECDLGKKLSSFIHDFGKNQFDSVVSSRKAPKGAKKLSVSITHVQGRQGGAWSGAKSVQVKGKLTQNGKVVGTFEDLRVSGGGFFGGYKGTCSILGRCVKTLGKDIAAWAANPSMNSRLGDL